METELNKRIKISPVGFGSWYSYEVSGLYLVGRLFGLFPIQRVHLGAVHYLRLASRTETPPLLLLFNWLHFMPQHYTTSPVYVLQTRFRYRIFLRMDASAHVELCSLISRHAVRSIRLAA